MDVSTAPGRCARATASPHVGRPPVFAVEPTPAFTRCRERLRARPGRPAEAVAKADRVLESLASGKATDLREAGSLTTWGENRVGGCGKFNLGGGYRLVFSRRGGTVVPQFIGNHEECHRWLMTNRGLDLRPDRRATPAAVESVQDAEDAPRQEQSPPAFPELNLSDHELRRVFAALCG